MMQTRAIEGSVHLLAYEKVVHRIVAVLVEKLGGSVTLTHDECFDVDGKWLQYTNDLDALDRDTIVIKIVKP